MGLFNRNNSAPIQFGKPVSTGSASKSKVVISMSAVFVLAGLIGYGVYLGNTKLWWFTKAYDARQSSSSFMDDVLNGDTSAAYKQASASMQSQNTADQFAGLTKPLANSKVKISPASYAVKDGDTITVVGVLKDPSTGKTKIYGVNVVKTGGQSKIDTLTVIAVNTKTALGPQVLALLNK